MSFTTLICLPFVIIIAIFFAATAINVTHNDHVFKPNYRNKHGKKGSSNE